MKLSISPKDNEANVAVALVKRGHPWLAYSLVIACRMLWALTVIGLAIVAAAYGVR